jgi:hypothetical protein
LKRFGYGHESRTRFFCITFNDKDFSAMPYALCALRYFETTMPAIASLEDLKAAQKDLLEAKDLGELKAVFKKWRRIGWKNVCGAPMGKGRAIQRLGGGDIPAPSEWSSLPGQALAGGTDSGTIER